MEKLVGDLGSALAYQHSLKKDTGVAGVNPGRSAGRCFFSHTTHDLRGENTLPLIIAPLLCY